jgi:hypothetical protein
MGNEEREFDIPIEEGAWIAVRMRRDPEKELDWAAIMRVRQEGRTRSLCVYDNAHGFPERHRIRQGRKLAGEPLPTKGAARLDLPAAIVDIKAKWRGWVERWEK